MTEFNPLLERTKVQVSFTDSSEQEEDSSKPLLRKKVVNSEEQIRYRPKSMSMISRSNYSSSEFRNSMMSSTMTVTQSVTSSKTSSNVMPRPQSYTETSTQSIQSSEMKAEKLFIKSVNFSSMSQKSTDSVPTIPVIRPISSSEPLYIQDIPSDSIQPAPVITKEVKIEIKESTPPIVRPLTPPPVLAESNQTSFVETDEHSQMDQETKSSAEDSDSSSITYESSSDFEHSADSSEAYSTPPIQQQQNMSDLLYCSIIPGKETTIEINRGISDLGINIIGGADTLMYSIHILTVLERGAAAKDGRLWPGDRILSVNGRDLRFATHEEAIEIIRNSPAQIRMVILRNEDKDSINNEKESDVYNLYEVELKKKGNQSLGLCIIGRRNDPGVFVTEVTPGGVADREGSIKRGDQILAINGKDIKIAGQEVAAQLVKNELGKIHLRMGRLKSGIPDDLMDMPVVADNRETSDDFGRSITSLEREKQNTRFVEIEKPYNTALGIYIAGGIGSPLGDVPVFVAMIEETNVIGGKLKIGDMIVSVNGQNTEKKTHDEVVSMMSTEEDMIILMQVQEPTEEIQKLSTYLTQAVKKSEKKQRTLEMDKRRNLERQQNVIDYNSSAQTETPVF